MMTMVMIKVGDNNDDDEHDEIHDDDDDYSDYNGDGELFMTKKIVDYPLNVFAALDSSKKKVRV